MSVPTWLIDLLTRLGWRPRPPAPPVPPKPPAPQPPGPVDSVGRDLIEAHNAARKRSGLPSLKLHPQLQAMAVNHASVMALTGIRSHDGAGDGPFVVRITKYGYTYTNAGENIGEGQASVSEVMGAWLNSPGHRRNIMGQYVDFGGAMAVSKYGVPYWCTVFGRPASAGAIPRAPRISLGMDAVQNQ